MGRSNLIVLFMPPAVVFDLIRAAQQHLITHGGMVSETRQNDRGLHLSKDPELFEPS
ncbi:MAG: hypothetical protein GQ544_08845 [Candidatus Aminicenantes bacterium]|nr:hypothetical protein [Candidatus Aminicenantes bacterium]